MATGSADQDEEAMNTQHARTTSVPQTAKKNLLQKESTLVAVPDTSRAMGEWSTYKYYFKSIGWRHGSLFFLMTLCEAFFVTFGSK